MVGRALASRAAIPILYVAIVLAFFSPVLLTNRVLLPTDNLVAFGPWRESAEELDLTRPNNMLSSDSILQNISWRLLAQASWASGQPPLWNPNIFGGQAFLATGQNQALYPPAIALNFLPPARWYVWFIALHLWLGMVFTHLFMREIGANRVGSTLAAVSFGLCGFLTVSTMWPQMIATAIWLPLILWGVERTIIGVEQRKGARAILFTLLILSVATGLQLTGGHPEIAFYNLAAPALYASARLIQCLRRSRRLADTAISVAALSGGFLLGGLLAAVQLVPLTEAGATNYRVGGTTYDQVRGYALPREAALAFVIPNVFGNPTHHRVFDLTTLSWRPASASNDAGTTEWGKKNFVEGTAYIGIVALLLAVLAPWLSRAPQRWPLALIAVFALLIAFGTPLFGILYSLVPGYSQLRTPFRWIFPYSFAAAALAGLALTALSSAAPTRVRQIGLGVLGLGGIISGGLLLSMLDDPAIGVRGQVIGWAESAIRGSDRLTDAFLDGGSLFSYQWANVAIATILLLASGAGILLSARFRFGPSVLIAVSLVDLFAFGIGYGTAGDPKVLDYVPPSVRALRHDVASSGWAGPFRITAFDHDVLPANTGALFGLEDIRGYDSIIQQDYVRYASAIDADNVRASLAFNRIEALTDPKTLGSPLVDALGVRYVFTRDTLSDPQLALVYDGPTKVYRRSTALPRVLLVGSAIAAVSQEDAMAQVVTKAINPANVAALEGSVTEQAPRPAGTAQVTSYANEEVRIQASSSAGGYLVLFDVAFPGWTAYVDGNPQTILRADGLFRAIELGPGGHDVVFAYQPYSWRIALLLSGTGLLVIVILAAITSWQGIIARYARRSTLARVVKNAAVPMAAGGLNKVLDLGLAIVMLRVLGPTDVGRYTWAVLVIGYLDILANFGLGVLLTRDLARDAAATSRYLGSAAAARLTLSMVALVIAGVVAGPLGPLIELTPEMGLTLVLLAVGIAISNLSGLVTAVMNSRELMEYPAYVGNLTAVLKLVGGVSVLLLGFGIVGLAAVSIAVNTITAVALVVLLAEVVGWPGLSMEPRFSVKLVLTSYPLMLNNLLSTLFFRVDGLILRPIWGDTVLGWYGAAYKFIDGLNLIPSQFTLALFPIFSRLAGSSDRLIPTVELALKTLLSAAFPIAFGTTLLAEPIIRIVAGEAYIPHSVVALQVLIWFLPFSFVNSLLQYVLIAVNQQRFITWAFVLASAFNIAANLILIPRFAYVGAAAATIASELILLGPFWYAIQRYVGPVHLLALAWRPIVAGLAMGLVTWGLASWPLAGVIVLSAVAYGAVLFAIGGVGKQERAFLRGLFGRGQEEGALRSAAEILD
ncbi:MAG: hypothetical protein EXR58_02335 [Chloroflexi bacterium]|nr:hypothetical protein [Chloroflexota bacterium]